MPQLSLVCWLCSLLLCSRLTCQMDPHYPDVCRAEGKALMFLLPSEQEAMLRRLAARKIPINVIKANPSKTQEITGSLQALLSKTPELKVRCCAEGFCWPGESPATLPSAFQSCRSKAVAHSVLLPAQWALLMGQASTSWRNNSLQHDSPLTAAALTLILPVFLHYYVQL